MQLSLPTGEDNQQDQQDQEIRSAVIRWRCPNCGQYLFTSADEDPPDLCAYCRDMTTWQRVNEPDSAD